MSNDEIEAAIRSALEAALTDQIKNSFGVLVSSYITAEFMAISDQVRERDEALERFRKGLAVIRSAYESAIS